MGPLLLLALLLLLSPIPALADDLGLFGNLTFTTKPDREVSKTFEVTRCTHPAGCNGTLALNLTGPVSRWLALTPPVLYFVEAPRGTRFESILHGRIPAAAPPGNYTGIVEVTSDLVGDRWGYHVQVTVQPPTGSLVLYSEPPGARVYLNDTLLGHTPISLTDFPAATHTLLLRKEGYRDRQENATITADRTRNLETRLEPRDPFPLVPLLLAAALAATGLAGLGWRWRRSRPVPGPPEDRPRDPDIGAKLEVLERELDALQVFEARIENRLRSIATPPSATPSPPVPEDLRVLPHRVAALELQADLLAPLREDLTALRQQVGTLAARLQQLAEWTARTPAEFDDIRLALRGLQRKIEGQEQAYARGEETRSLFRDLSRQKEELAHLQLKVEQLTQEGGSRTIVLEARGKTREGRTEPGARETLAPPPPERPTGQPGPWRDELEKKIEETERYLAAIEESHRSGILSPRAHRELREANERKLEDLRRRREQTP
ncbi:MAG: PEGA domain-containing protein [Euryarchaeota archaeon]|nr:PEGA domain-containing protein [Euryarchaeota archaeon]